MVTKGEHTARSQSYTAILHIKDQVKSTLTISGNDVFPSPLFTPITHDQHIIDTIYVLFHSLGESRLSCESQ
jgi:hypothetical protein